MYGRYPQWLVDMAVGFERQPIKPPFIFSRPLSVLSMNLSDTEARRRVSGLSLTNGKPENRAVPAVGSQS